MSSYTVKGGDTLSTIAERVLGHASLWPKLAQLNHIAAPYTIYVGDVLQLPPIPSSLPATTGTSPAPATTTAAGGGAAGAGGLVHRLVTWAKANPGLATFWGLSLTLSAAGLYVMVTRSTPASGRRRRRKK